MNIERTKAFIAPEQLIEAFYFELEASSYRCKLYAEKDKKELLKREQTHHKALQDVIDRAIFLTKQQ